MVQVPALCRSRPALAAGMRCVLFQDDDLVEGLAEHLGRGDSRDTAADHHRGAAPTTADVGQIDRGVVQPWRGSPARGAAGHELLVVQAGSVDTVVIQPFSGIAHQPSRAAQVHVGVTAVEHARVEHIGDPPQRPVPLGARTGDDGVDFQPRQPPLQRLEFVELAEIFDVAHAVHQMDRAPVTVVQAVRHREDRRQSGAAGHQDHRPHRRSQIEAALAAPHGDSVAEFGLLAQIVRHHALRQQPDDELHLGASVGGMRIGIVPPHAGPWHLQLSELSRQIDQRVQPGDIDTQQRRRRRHVLDRGHHTSTGDQPRGVVIGRVLQADHTVGLREGLTGQHLAGIPFDLGKPFGAAHLVIT